MAFLQIDAIRGMQQSYQDFMWFSAIRGFKVTLPRGAGPAEIFVAAHRGNNMLRRSLTTAALPRAIFARPLVTLKIVAAIHCEALRLRLKGARLAPRPHAAAANANTGLANGERPDYTGAALSAVGREPGSRESARVQ
jgi:DUF1365 family protein